MSYGLTPSEPTIPALTTLPGIHVEANNNKTPITGAVSNPNLKRYTAHLDDDSFSLISLGRSEEVDFGGLIARGMGMGMYSG